MTKEELKKEAEELYEDWYAHKLGAISIVDVICKMAEPREKRIAELEAQIEKMKCCANCKHSRTEYEHCRTNKHEKWEIKEK